MLLTELIYEAGLGKFARFVCVYSKRLSELRCYRYAHAQPRSIRYSAVDQAILQNAHQRDLAGDLALVEQIVEAHGAVRNAEVFGVLCDTHAVQETDGERQPLRWRGPSARRARLGPYAELAPSHLSI